MPLVIGSAGSAGAKPHLEATLAIIREIARAEGLHFRLGVLRADLSRDMLRASVRAGAVIGIDDMPALTEEEVTEAEEIVGQMGMGPFRRALAEDIDVLIAGAPAIPRSSPRCRPCWGSRSVCRCTRRRSSSVRRSAACLVAAISILATLDGRGVRTGKHGRAAARDACLGCGAQPDVRRAEQIPPPYTNRKAAWTWSAADYAAVDDRRCRVTGAARRESTDPVREDREGARRIGERAVLLAGAADPRFIAQHREILPAVATVVRDLVCEDAPEDYTLRFRVYGIDGVRMAAPAGEAPPGEVFVMGECIAPTAERAAEVVRTLKQYLLHHGYAGRLSTAGNLAFPFTPPEVSLGPAYRFNVYHLLRTPDPDALFPLEIETL